jgi:hypothetical protein
MKQITLLTFCSILTLMAFNACAVVGGISGPVTMTLTAFAQDYSGLIVSVRTNHTATTTNVTTITKSKETNAPINSEFLLDLLENSFQTNFPSGSKLIVAGVGSLRSLSLLVVDRSGSNVLLDASSVFSLTNGVGVSSGITTLIQSTTRTGTQFSGNTTQTATEYVTVTYNDTALTTTDGTHTNFQLSGVLVDMITENERTFKTTEVISLHVAGTGTIRDKTNIILKGTASATLTGHLEPT